MELISDKELSAIVELQLYDKEGRFLVSASFSTHQ